MEPAEAPSASWHPAMMPQSIPQARPVAAEPTPQPSPPPPEQSSAELQSREPEPEFTPNDDMTSANATNGATDRGTVLDHFDDGDDDAAAAWDLSEEPPIEATSQGMAQEVAPAKDAAAEAPLLDDDAAAWDLPEEAPAEDMARDMTQDATPVEGAAAEVHMPDVQPEPEPEAEPEMETTGNTAKHSSRISFARTVSHEPNFNDSEHEEDEWSIQRSDTDPFNFMPPSERTNSFPTVPPAHHDIDEPLGEPPAATQAQDILQELEQEELHDDLSAGRGFPYDQEGETSHADHFDQTAGRDMAGDYDTADNRFEEGLPLISHDQSESRQGDPQPAASAGLDDAFADEAGDEGDDFFSNVQGGSNAEEDGFHPTQPIQRKDTSMFTGAPTNQEADPVSFEPETPTIAEAGDAALDDEAAAGLQQAANEEAQAANEEPQAANEEPQAATEEPQVATSEANPEAGTKEAAPVDLDAKWAEAFAGDDDDDFLLDDTNETKELDPADFFGSDDEGFLEDTPDDGAAAPTKSQMATPAAPVTGAGVNGRYTPSNVPSPSFPSLNTFNSTPGVPQVQQAAHPLYAPSNTAPPAVLGYGAPPPPRPEPSKAQSFVNQAKGGYSSPYDLPMDVVKPPKKRASMQLNPRAAPGQLAPPVAPPRAASLYNQPPAPSGTSNGSISPTPSNHSSQPPPPGSKPTSQLKPKSGFFEDLPIVTKPRPGSRQSAPSPGLSPGPPQGPPMTSPSLASPPMQPPVSSPLMQPPMVSPPLQRAPSQPSQNIAGLVAPERTNPYAPVQADNALKPSAPATSRYSPAPPANGTVPAPAPPNRYSPAPPSRSGSAQYSAVPPPILAHQPRTSSPLAHFESATDHAKLPSPAGSDGFPMARTSSSQYDPRLHRVSSLPPTQEVEEDGAQLQPSPALSRSASSIPPGPAQSRYNPLEARQTPPLMSPPAANALSPPKRATSSYVPQAPSSGTPKPANYAPPPRSQTQSPRAMYSPRVAPVPRPSSVQGASPRSVAAPHQQTSPIGTRPRGMSQSLNLVAPTDGREKDALQRWRGAPLVSWGVGGTIISSFPKDVPRYGISGNVPMIIRSPGEVKIKHVKDIQPLEELLSKFPGPLKGKSKKKETIAWLTTGIDMQESALPNVVYQNHLSHEDKRAVERVLLLKILRVLVEQDGVLEGNPIVEKAVRQILSPGLEVEDMDLAPGMATGADLQGTPAATGMQADAIDSAGVEQMRKHLLVGDREKAAWAAVDKRLWGHAMIIANTVPGDLYKQVAQEFVKKEVNHPGRNNESLAALYGVMSGNLEEAVDELVPSHARAGRQLMSTSEVANQSQDALAGLDKWRETLGLILSNRSTADTTAIISLGKLLSSYGRAEAAHICFMFARQQAVFGGLDDPSANFVLIGADHRGQADHFAKETEALLLSEVYEYGLSLCSGSPLAHGCPHLAAYKLQHAMTLAEYGMKDRALQYCESIIAAITSQTKRSPYYHPILESSVDNLMNRLKMAPREGSTSWISKPNMNSVSNSLLSKFNKFVAGDETDTTDSGALTDPGAESGPFARIAGGTPSISRTPSISGFDAYGNGATVPSYGASPPATRAASRYAPSAGQGSPYAPGPGYNPAPRSSMERSSGEMNRGSIELPRQMEPTPMYGGYAPEANSTATFGFQPVAAAAPASSSYAPAASTAAPASQPPTHSYTPYEPQAAVNAPEFMPPAEQTSANDGYQAPSYGYEPPSLSSFDEPVPHNDEPAASGGGYQPPSYGFEPPSYEPGQDDNELTEKPKKKGIMDDDEDDIPAQMSSTEKSKAEKDRENEELFRKAAEEDAKRAEAAKSQKKGWLGGWFGGGAKKEPAEIPNKPVRAKLGESSSFVYDPDLKRWVNKKPGAENTPAKTATPPPPRGTPPPPSSGAGPPGTPPVSAGTPPPPMGGGPPMRSLSGLSKQMSSDSLNVPGAALGGAPPLARTPSAMSNVSTGSGEGGPSSLMPPSGPPSRPATSLSNASSIDDLLGAAGPRKPGAAKKGRKSGRYVDVMAK